MLELLVFNLTFKETITEDKCSLIRRFHFHFSLYADGKVGNKNYTDRNPIIVH